MIVFDLECDAGHGFEGWFDSSDAFERQKERGLLECPMCGIKTIVKRLSAPRLNLGAKAPTAPAAEAVRQSVAMSTGTPGRSAPADDHAKLVAAQTEFYRHLRQMLARSHDVGDRFAEEARRIHYKETPERQIHGSATREETVELIEEGIPVLPMPFGLKHRDELN